jgi:hypothetical protein
MTFHHLQSMRRRTKRPAIVICGRTQTYGTIMWPHTSVRGEEGLAVEAAPGRVVVLPLIQQTRHLPAKRKCLTVLGMVVSPGFGVLESDLPKTDRREQK